MKNGLVRRPISSAGHLMLREQNTVVFLGQKSLRSLCRSATERGRVSVQPVFSLFCGNENSKRSIKSLIQPHATLLSATLIYGVLLKNIKNNDPLGIDKRGCR